MELITAIVKCPKGCTNKYEYEPEKGNFKLSKIMPPGMAFPYDFGFIPDTKGEDGDALDIILISEVSTFAGCYVDCRIIGAIKAEQTERDGSKMRNDRFLAIPKVSQEFKDIRDISHLPGEIIIGIESFFKNYNQQAGKQFKVIELLDAERAYGLI